MELGRITHIDDIREIWSNEARDFTPWLADNIELLGEELGIDIELIGTEQSVGSFSLDILAKDTNSGTYIAIENQLEPTDHSHLGQLLTYASGLSATVLVWVARQIREEHRKAVDWLNEITSDEVQFFAVEVQAIKVDNSLPAPLFKVKASPNDWSKTTTRITTSGVTQRSTKGEYYHEFFTTLLGELHRQHPSFTNARKVGYDSWFGFSVGNAMFAIQLAFRSGDRFSCELYIDSGDKPTNEDKFDELMTHRAEIEAVLGELSWERLDNRRACRIAKYVDVLGDAEMIQWGIDAVVKFREVFQPRMRHK